MNNDQAHSPLINSVVLEGLFGQFDYEISLRHAGSSEHHLLLLYGDNGAGKSTILRLIFHLLNPEPYAAHRTSIAQVPFRRIAIHLTTGVVVVAERDDPFNKTEYLIRFRSPDKEINWLWEEDRNTREHPHEDYEQYCAALSQTGISFRFLPDTRRVEGLPDDPRRRPWTSRRHISAAERHAIENGFIDPSMLPTESLVGDAIKRTIGWLRHQTLSASNIGYTSVNAVYAALIRRVVEKGRDTEQAEPLSLDALQDELLSLYSRNENFSKYGLTPELQINEIAKLLKQASKKDVPLLNTVLRPYFDGHNARLDALQPVQKIVNEFVSMLSEFYSRKQIHVNMAAGVTVRTPDDQQLDADLLSSGEKQLLLLLCNTITARQDGMIVIIDEPEISLNVKWQRRLVEALLTCLDGVRSQLILATHSIEILAQHRESVVSLDAVSSADNA